MIFFLILIIVILSSISFSISNTYGKSILYIGVILTTLGLGGFSLLSLSPSDLFLHLSIHPWTFGWVASLLLLIGIGCLLGRVANYLHKRE